MGVISFFQIEISKPKTKEELPRTIGGLSREITLPKMKGMRVCIDTPNMIYSSILAMQTIQALTDSEGRTTAHINTIWAKIVGLDQAGIQQIWIFDSKKPNALKAAELKRRYEKAFNSTDPKVQFRMNSEHIEDIKTLLRLCGQTYVEAPEGVEAEQYGAWMTRGPIARARFCQYMISADSDVLAFGGNLIRPYQKPSSTGKSKRLVYQVYELADILSEIDMDYDKFLEVCVAMGTDFCDKTPGTGVKTVLDKVRAGKISINPQQESVIAYYKSKPTFSESDISYNKYDKAGLEEFLVSKNFKLDRVQERMSGYPKIINA
jgi:flap endonuclease-1